MTCGRIANPLLTLDSLAPLWRYWHDDSRVLGARPGATPPRNARSGLGHEQRCAVGLLASSSSFHADAASLPNNPINKTLVLGLMMRGLAGVETKPAFAAWQCQRAAWANKLCPGPLSR